VIAHSQGALVARRAIQLMQTQGTQLVDSLVLLGPANHGSMSAVRGLGGEASEIALVRKFAVEPPQGFDSVLGTMSGLYQLIPSRADLVPWVASNQVGGASFWGALPIDPARLAKFYGWAEQIDTSFFNDRTTIILGDNNGDPTVGGVFIDGSGAMQVDARFGMEGDGTITHSCAVLPDVAAYLAPGTEHSRLPTYANVIEAIQVVLAGGIPSLSPARSNDPHDYTGLIPMPTRSLVPGQAPTISTASAPALGAQAPEALERLVDSMAGTARRSGARIRIAIQVEPGGNP
jgi:hypothetical protein